jgi:hypothetical protein
MDVEYVYEGTSKVSCTKCGFKHEVFFTGDNNFHPEEAIDLVLLEEGWEVGNMVCPNCYDASDPIEEKRVEDEMQEYWDEYNDYEEDYDNEEDV